MAAVTAVMSLRTTLGAALSRDLALHRRFAVALPDNFSYYSERDDDESTFFVSEDAMEWEEHSLPDNVFGRVSQFEYTNGGFLAWIRTEHSSGGTAATVFTSEDGRSWTRDEINAQVSVVYRNAEGRLFAGGRRGLLLERR